MRTALLAGALAAALVAAPSSAAAATALELSSLAVDPDVRSVDLVLSATDLPPGSGLDPASLVVTVDGRTLPATSVVSATQVEQQAPPRVLLVVDTSGSMQGQPMLDAQEALTSFAATTPARVELGLLRFSTDPELLVAPAPDRAGLLGAVAGLRAQGETSLYDAVLAGISALGTAGDRRLVVLSDGGDTRSSAALAQVLAATADSGVVLDAIGFGTDESVLDVLAQLASSGSGRVLTAASAAELGTALDATVRAFPTALSVRVVVPQDLRGEQTITASVSSARGLLTATSPVVLGQAPAPAPSGGWWGSRDALLVGLAAIAASLLLGSLVLLSSQERDRRRTQDVLERFTTSPSPVRQDLRTASPVARNALELADRVTTTRRHASSGLRLARAAVSLTPAEWLLLQSGAAVGSVLLLVLLGAHPLAALLVGVAAGALVPSAWLRSRGRRRQRAFEQALPDALQMTAGGLSAGYSLAQALDGLVREGREPMASEIGKALAESRLGVPVEKSLEGVAERMGSRDFAWVVMAIRVQREVGGNLAGVLTTVGATMRERAMLRRHVQGLSAEGRLSAYILVGLPISLALFMLTARREYIEPLYTTGVGIVMVAAAVLLLSFGSFVMSRMVKVEV